MIAFAVAALVLIGATLVFLLPPLLRGDAVPANADSSRDANLLALRDQLRELQAERAAGLLDANAYEEAKRELQMRVARDVQDGVPVPGASRASRSAWLVAGGVPVAAIALYVLLGNPLALVPEFAGGANAHGPSEQQIEQMVAGLAERLQREPNDPEGWEMLARSYNAMGRYQDASAAYAQLVRLNPDDAALYADYADTLGMALGRTLQGEPEALIDRALALDPDNVKALALAGSAAFERADYARAIAQWTRLVEVAPPDSDIAQSTASSIAEARIRLQGGASTSLAADADADADAASARIEGVVDIEPALRARLTGNETVFIYARPAAGPQPPLAVLRIQASQLPYTFVLDDSMSMMPNRRLSDAGEVIVGARLSASGSIAAGVTDPQTASAPVAIGTKNVRLRIPSP